MPPTDMTRMEAAREQLSHAHHEPRGEGEHQDEGKDGHHRSRHALAEVDVVEQVAGLSGVDEIGLIAFRRGAQ